LHEQAYELWERGWKNRSDAEEQGDSWDSISAIRRKFAEANMAHFVELERSIRDEDSIAARLLLYQVGSMLYQNMEDHVSSLRCWRRALWKRSGLGTENRIVHGERCWRSDGRGLISGRPNEKVGSKRAGGPEASPWSFLGSALPRSKKSPCPARADFVGKFAALAKFESPSHGWGKLGQPKPP
jgi:hypothetical protein